MHRSVKKELTAGMFWLAVLAIRHANQVVEHYYQRGAITVEQMVADMATEQHKHSPQSVSLTLYKVLPWFPYVWVSIFCNNSTQTC